MNFLVLVESQGLYGHWCCTATGTQNMSHHGNEVWNKSWKTFLIYFRNLFWLISISTKHTSFGCGCVVQESFSMRLVPYCYNCVVNVTVKLYRMEVICYLVVFNVPQRWGKILNIDWVKLSKHQDMAPLWEMFTLKIQAKWNYNQYFRLIPRLQQTSATLSSDGRMDGLPPIMYIMTRCFNFNFDYYTLYLITASSDCFGDKLKRDKWILQQASLLNGSSKSHKSHP